MIKPEKLVSLFNTLIEINSDRAEGYKIAAAETSEPDLKILFSQFQQTSLHCKTQIVAEMHRLRRIPIHGVKVSGNFYKIWAEFKESGETMNRVAILAACLKGEDYANSVYQRALESRNDQLSPDNQAMVYAQYEQIKAEFEEVRILLDQTEEQS